MKIEKDIPIPEDASKQTSQKEIDLFLTVAETMLIGDSIFIEGRKESTVKRWINSFYEKNSYACSDWTFAIQKYKEGVRVWRVE